MIFNDNIDIFIFSLLILFDRLQKEIDSIKAFRIQFDNVQRM